MVVATGGGDAISVVSGGAATGLLGPDPARDGFGAEQVDMTGTQAGSWHSYGNYLRDEQFSRRLLEVVSERPPAEVADW